MAAVSSNAYHQALLLISAHAAPVFLSMTTLKPATQSTAASHTTEAAIMFVLPLGRIRIYALVTQITLLIITVERVIPSTHVSKITATVSNFVSYRVKTIHPFVCVKPVTSF